VPQHYKLRLGDGQFLSVDAAGLRAWAHDPAALVQAVGSQRWRSLREVLAEEADAARLLQALGPHEPEPAGPEEPTFLPSRPALQVLADDPASLARDEAADEASSDDMPVIPLKPLDEAPAFRSAWEEEGGEADLAEEEDEPRTDRLEGPLLSVLQTLGGLLSRGLRPLAPLTDRLAERWARARERRETRAEEEPEPAPPVVQSAPEAGPEVMPLAEDPGRPGWLEGDAEEEPRPQGERRPSLRARLAAWARGLRERPSRPAEEEEEPGPAEEEPEEEPAPAPPRAPVPPPPEARRPVAPPPPIAEMPSLRLAPSRERAVRQDVYEPRRPSTVLPSLLRWTRRIAVVGLLAAVVAYAVLEWDSWLPRAAEVGQETFTGIDRLVGARQRAEEQREALAAAGEQLPQLAPETILLVFGRSPTGVVEPAEVFQATREAADRGRSALAPAEREQLRDIERELAGALRPTERSRLREYDEARARRVVFSFENPPAMALVARGARALPPERLERLRALLHAAVVAGLDAPAAPRGGAGEP
jgi:hypothetical protein